MNKKMALRSSKFNVLEMNCFAPSVFVLTPRHLFTLKFYFMFQRNYNIITNITIKESKISEMESSRTSLVLRSSSRTHFEVLGLGLEASSPWPWPRPRSLRSLKIALSSARGQHYFLNR